MNYLSALLVITGFFLSTNVETPSKVDFEKLKDVDRDFVNFLGAFEKTDLPYEMTKEEIIALEETQPNYKRNENALLSKFIDGPQRDLPAFSRGGPPIIVPLKRFYPTEKTVAVTFQKKGRFMDASASIMVAVFTLKGKLISFKEKMLDGKFKQRYDTNPYISVNHYDQMETFRITENGILHKTTYKKIWQKDWKEHGVENNKVVSYDILSQETLQFSEEGALVSLDKKDFGEIADIALRP